MSGKKVEKAAMRKLTKADYCGMEHRGNADIRRISKCPQCGDLVLGRGLCRGCQRREGVGKLPGGKPPVGCHCDPDDLDDDCPEHGR